MTYQSVDYSSQAISIYLTKGKSSISSLLSIRKKMLDTETFHEDYSVISYSKNIFIPVTRLCRDFCKYCAFRVSEQKLSDKKKPYLEMSQITTLLEQAQSTGCTEALFTLGQSPEDKYKSARSWLDDNGYNSTIDYIYDLCKLSLEYGILPHSNPGLMSPDEFSKLQEVNASMGLMLETTSQSLFLSSEGPHHHAPSKLPEKRIKMLEIAGKTHHPFTTGLLLGIGEEKQDVVNALQIIKELHEKYGHIQEIILQPFIPHPRTFWSQKAVTDETYLLETVLLNSILIPEIPLQVPPNLNHSYEKFIHAGCRDFGGVSPVTIDYVNPENAWPTINELKQASKQQKLDFRERLAVYPKYVRSNSEKWLSQKIRSTIKQFDLKTDDGFRK